MVGITSAGAQERPVSWRGMKCLRGFAKRILTSGIATPRGFPGPRQRPRAALSGSQFCKAPGFAGGYLRVPSMFGSLEVKVLFTA